MERKFDISMIDLQWFGSSENANVRSQRLANESNEKIAAENLEYQREWNDYQKQLNEKLMQREDTAIQRQVTDARAAGISPLVAANVGQAQSTGSASVTGQPLNNSQHVDAVKGLPDQLDQITKIVNLASQGMQQITDLTQAVQNIRANADQSRFNRETYNDRKNAIKYDSLFKGWNLYDFARDAVYNQEYGTTRSMGDKERFVRSFLSTKDGKKLIKSTLDPFDPSSPSFEFSTPRNITSDDLKKLIVSFLSDGDAFDAPTSFPPLPDFSGTTKKAADIADDVYSSVLNSIEDGLDKITPPSIKEYNEKKKKTSSSKKKTEGMNARSGASGSW